jgi:hypothetical protein
MQRNKSSKNDKSNENNNIININLGKEVEKIVQQKSELVPVSVEPSMMEQIEDDGSDELDKQLVDELQAAIRDFDEIKDRAKSMNISIPAVLSDIPDYLTNINNLNQVERLTNDLRERINKINSMILQRQQAPSVTPQAPTTAPTPPVGDTSIPSAPRFPMRSPMPQFAQPSFATSTTPAIDPIALQKQREIERLAQESILRSLQETTGGQQTTPPIKDPIKDAPDFDSSFGDVGTPLSRANKIKEYYENGKNYPPQRDMAFFMNKLNSDIGVLSQLSRTTTNPRVKAQIDDINQFLVDIIKNPPTSQPTPPQQEKPTEQEKPPPFEEEKPDDQPPPYTPPDNARKAYLELNSRGFPVPPTPAVTALALVELMDTNGNPTGKFNLLINGQRLPQVFNSDGSFIDIENTVVDIQSNTGETEINLANRIKALFNTNRDIPGIRAIKPNGEPQFIPRRILRQSVENIANFLQNTGFFLMEGTNAESPPVTSGRRPTTNIILARQFLINKLQEINNFPVEPINQKYKNDLMNRVQVYIRSNLPEGNTTPLSEVYIPYLTDVNYDVKKALAYSRGHTIQTQRQTGQQDQESARAGFMTVSNIPAPTPDEMIGGETFIVNLVKSMFENPNNRPVSPRETRGARLPQDLSP